MLDFPSDSQQMKCMFWLRDNLVYTLECIDNKNEKCRRCCNLVTGKHLRVQDLIGVMQGFTLATS